jgi:omega-6 fatty acid desaturase (delta-12 desaturase)
MNDEINTNHEKINETELFIKYKSSYTSAFIDLFVHTFLIFSSLYLLWYFKNSWLSFLTVPLFGMLNIKTFMIFHDCGHNSYTPNKNLNYIIGLLLSCFISHPFFWNYNHNTHHNVNGNIENKYNYYFNETTFYTLKHYKSWSNISRCLFKFVKTPLFFFTIPIYLKILITHQLRIIPFIMYKTYDCKIPRIYLIVEQLVSTCGLLLTLYICNLYDILLLFIMSCFIGFTITVIIVHNEHTYNPSYVVGNNDWNYKDSGLRGSSFILIPSLLKYFFHGIEYHHIHHMNAKIPGYNLQKYHEEVVSKSNLFDNVVNLSMTDCYNNLWLCLYNEDKKKYITFEEADKEISNDKNV